MTTVWKRKLLLWSRGIDWDILLTWSFMLLRVMWRRLLRGWWVQATLYMTSSWEWQLCRGPGSPMVSSWSLSHEIFLHDFIFSFSIDMTMIGISEYPMLKVILFRGSPMVRAGDAGYWDGKRWKLSSTSLTWARVVHPGFVTQFYASHYLKDTEDSLVWDNLILGQGLFVKLPSF